MLARYLTSQFLQYKDLAPPTRASLSYTLVSAQLNQLISQVIEEKCFFEQHRDVNRNKIHQIVINKNDDFQSIKMYVDSFWINRNIGEFKHIESRLSSWTLPCSIFCGLTIYLKPNLLSLMQAIELNYCSPLSHLHHGIKYWIAILNIRNVPYRNRKMY